MNHNSCQGSFNRGHYVLNWGGVGRSVIEHYLLISGIQNKAAETPSDFTEIVPYMHIIFLALNTAWSHTMCSKIITPPK